MFLATSSFLEHWVWVPSQQALSENGLRRQAMMVLGKREGLHATPLYLHNAQRAGEDDDLFLLYIYGELGAGGKLPESLFLVFPSSVLVL